MENQFFKSERLKDLFKAYGKVFKENEVIFEENSQPSKFYVIYRGKVKIVLEGTVLNTLGDGDIFGEISLIDKEPHSASAISVSESKILVFEEEMFMKFMEDNQALNHMLKTMIIRISRLSDMSAKLLERKERTRVLVSLTNLIKSVMKSGIDKVVFDVPKAISRISNDTKLDENVVAKYIKEMEIQNKIKIRGDKIVISNVMLLRKVDSGEVLTDWVF